jgi:hypothetical protein
MELHELVTLEWREDHVLSKRSLIWVRDHAQPGDPHPVATAIEQLRREERLANVTDAATRDRRAWPISSAG